MATWTLKPDRVNLHGHFSRDLAPVVTIESGDTVEFTTLVADWGSEIFRESLDGPLPKVEPRDELLDRGHCLVGPVFVQGAKPGMTLEIRVNRIVPGDWGWTVGGGWSHAINERLDLVDTKGMKFNWRLSPSEGTGANQFGHRVELRPFMGVMGMPADEPGVQSTTPPRVTGGNLDCKEIVAGTSLFLPIAVEGGLFSTGDGHARQGDGEVSVTAIECPMEHCSLTFLLHPEMHIVGPRVRTPDSWMTLGMDEDLHEASMKALDAMVDLMVEMHGLERDQALALASVVVDLRVTQLANTTLGVHAVLRDDAVLFS